MKMTPGGLRLSRLVEIILGTPDFAWFIKAHAEYAARTEITMEDALERSVAEVREVLRRSNQNHSHSPRCVEETIFRVHVST